MSNAFNTTNRVLTLDVISGRASRDYACGLKQGDAIPTIDTLTTLFGYFKSMRTCHAKLRYFRRRDELPLTPFPPPAPQKIAPNFPQKNHAKKSRQNYHAKISLQK